MTTHKQKMGKRIQEARKEAGFRSARELADRLGVRRETVSAYEAGMYEVPTENLRKISDLTGKAVSWFYGDTIGTGHSPTPEHREAPASQQEPPWSTLLDAVQAIPQAASASTREDFHAVEQAVLRLANEVQELRAELRLLSGGKASVSDEGEGSASAVRSSRRTKAAPSRPQPKARGGFVASAAAAIHMSEQQGAPQAVEAALRGEFSNGGAAPEPDAGSLPRQAAGSDRNGGSAG